MSSIAAAGNGGLDSIAEAKLQAMQALHNQKVKILMKSVNTLKEEITVLKAQSKDHRRSAMIQNMREKLRKEELVSDVLKSELIQKAQGALSIEDVNELIIKKTLDGPLRFRPKTREELQNELASLEKKHQRALEKLKQQQQQQQQNNRAPSPAGGGGGGGSGLTIVPPSPFPAAAAGTPSKAGLGMATVDLEQVSDLVEQVESLRVAVRSRDITLGRYTEEVERSRAELRELRVLQDRLAAREKKLEEARDRQREADALYQKALQNQENALEEMERVKAESDLFKEELKLENDALKQQCLDQITNIRDLLQRESELTSELDRVRQSSLLERQSVLKDVRAKESLLEDLRKQLRDAAQSKGRMEEKVKAAEEHIKQAKEEASEVYAVKEKLREANNACQSLERKMKESKERWEEKWQNLQAANKAREEELLAKLSGEKEALGRDLMAQLEGRDKSAQELKQFIEKLTVEKEGLSKEKLELQEKMASMEKLEQELKVESIFIKKDLAQREQDLLEAKKEAKILVDGVETLKREVAAAKQEGREAADELEEMAEERSELMKLLEKHEAELREAQVLLSDQTQTEQLRQQVLTLEKEKALAEENEKIAKAEVSSLHEKLTTLEAKAYGDVSNLREDFHTVKNEMSALEIKLRKAEAENQQKEDIIASLEKKVARRKSNTEENEAKRRRSLLLVNYVNELRSVLDTNRIAYNPPSAELNITKKPKQMTKADTEEDDPYDLSDDEK